MFRGDDSKLDLSVSSNQPVELQLHSLRKMFKLKASHAFTTYKKRRDAKLVAECTEPVILHSGMSTWCQLAKSWMTTVLSELPSWGLSCLLPPGFMVVNWRTSPDAKMRVVGAKEKGNFAASHEGAPRQPSTSHLPADCFAKSCDLDFNSQRSFWLHCFHHSKDMAYPRPDRHDPT